MNSRGNFPELLDFHGMNSFVCIWYFLILFVCKCVLGFFGTHSIWCLVILSWLPEYWYAFALQSAFVMVLATVFTSVQLLLWSATLGYHSLRRYPHVCTFTRWVCPQRTCVRHCDSLLSSLRLSFHQHCDFLFVPLALTCAALLATKTNRGVVLPNSPAAFAYPCDLA